MESVELPDIQGMLVYGYTGRKHAVYTMLRVRDGETHAARAWLAHHKQYVRSAERHAHSAHKKHDPILAIGFSHGGLRQFGLSERALASFVAEFRQGMDAPQRARMLGDVGDNAPERWAWGSGAQVPHLLVAAFGDDHAALRDALGLGTSAFAQIFDLVREVHCELRPTLVNGQKTGGFREPFGFRDGISQPDVQAFERPGGYERPDWNRVPAGEFVLGYPNALCHESASPRLDARDDDAGQLPRLADGSADFGRNGSFMVVRELDQDVAAFQRLPPEAQAKVMGRWPSGTSLTVAPHKDDPQLAASNDFRYFDRDRAGVRCPLGSHVRRANPRDGFTDADLGLSAEQAIAQANQHRVLRRGRPYWNGERTGTLFVCFNTNLERQFEFIQQTWLGASERTRPDAELDISLGLPTRMTVQGCGLPQQVDLPRLVTVRGGSYFFLPGLRALEYLSQPRAAPPHTARSAGRANASAP